MMLKINKRKCLKCGGCVSVCPANALELKSDLMLDPKKCTKCKICVDFCPVGALRF